MSERPKTSERMKSPRRRRNGRGILWLIALSFVASAVVRIGGETGVAIAEMANAEAASETGSTCAEDTDITAVLALLRERETAVAARESALEDRAQALAVAETQVRKNLEALEQAENDLKRMISLSSAAAEDDLAQLTAVYENMKPKQAAEVFAAMTPEFAAGFLSRMRTDAAAQIMAGLDPETAYAISVLLAGRNATAPTD